ncbi:MAG: EamA family transporter [Actinomycetota bacterium]
MSILFVLGTVAFTVYGQLIIKHEIDRLDSTPSGVGIVRFLVQLVFTRPLVLSGLVAAAIASLFWMAALSRLDLSFAYPFMALSFVAVVFLSALWFDESLSITRLLGLLLIVGGVLTVAAGG